MIRARMQDCGEGPRMEGRAGWSGRNELYFTLDLSLCACSPPRVIQNTTIIESLPLLLLFSFSRSFPPRSIVSSIPSYPGCFKIEIQNYSS